MKMEKFENITDINNSSILIKGREFDYSIAVNDDDLLLDDQDLSDLLKDAGVEFIDNDDTHYIYIA